MFSGRYFRRRVGVLTKSAVDWHVFAHGCACVRGFESDLRPCRGPPRILVEHGAIRGISILRIALPSTPEASFVSSLAGSAHQKENAIANLLANLATTSTSPPPQQKMESRPRIEYRFRDARRESAERLISSPCRKRGPEVGRRSMQKTRSTVGRRRLGRRRHSIKGCAEDRYVIRGKDRSVTLSGHVVSRRRPPSPPSSPSSPPSSSSLSPPPHLTVG